jgi:hypothetical protein
MRVMICSQTQFPDLGGAIAAQPSDDRVLMNWPNPLDESVADRKIGRSDK